MDVDLDSMDDRNELSHVEGLPASVAATFDPDAWSEVEWARWKGAWACSQRPDEVEGGWFVDLGENCSLVGMKGAQHLHSDRHFVEGRAEQTGHCWNAVIDADGDQMLLVSETRHAYRHHRLDVGALIYFNVYQPHLVSRTDPQDRCVIVQVAGIGPNRPREALETMGRALERAADARRKRA